MIYNFFLFLLCKVEDASDIKSVSDSMFADSDVENRISSSVELEVKEGTKKSPISRISPSAKLLALEFGLDISSIRASGPHGTLLKGDVLAFIKSGDTSSKSSNLPQQTLPVTSQKSNVDSQTSTLQSQSSGYPQPMDSYKDLENSQIRKVCFLYPYCLFIFDEVVNMS